MRLAQDKADFLKAEISKYIPGAEVYLFGSRANDSKRGGDIDILVLADSELSFSDKNKVVVAFWKAFGEQKVDIVSFTYKANSPFKEIAMKEAVRL